METGITANPEPKAHGDGASEFKAYLTVFALLCGFTAVSFICNELERNEVIGKFTSLAFIVLVAVIKAACVATIFMHLRSVAVNGKGDWSLVYFIIIPVTVMSVMMIIVLLPDIVIYWRHVPAAPFNYN